MKTKKPVRWEKVHRLPDAEWKNLIAGAAWESVAILLLLFAALFTLFQLADRMSLYKVHVLVLVVGITGVVFLREAVLQKLLSLVQDKKWAVLCRIAVSALLTFVIGWNLWRYGKAHYIELKSGYHAFLKNFYVDYFLTFQKSVIISGVDEDELSAFLCFAVLCVFTVLFALSPIGRRKYLFLGVPIGAIALVMYVGKAPSWKGICLMAAGALLIHRSWRRKGYYISNAIVIAVMMGLILLVGAVMNPSAKQVLARSKEVKAFEARLEARITQFFSGVPTTGGKDTVVTNQPPRYRDEKILTIRLDHAPEGNLYLQETSGRSYDKGRWS
ncbi:MAG: hypothetical protein J5546_06855, partial [Lachnospiraceae bacterium]|nr:hypothetical protein [Lachnospiraceae bacterium]